MLKEEFEKLTGMQVDEATFQGIHEMYMMAGDGIGKEEFCQAYKFMSSKTSTLRVMLGIYKTAKQLQEDTEKAKNEALDLYTNMKKHLKYKHDMGIFLLEEAHRTSSTSARAAAITNLGRKEYLVECLEREYELWGEDMEMLLEFLKENDD